MPRYLDLLGIHLKQFRVRGRPCSLNCPKLAIGLCPEDSSWSRVYGWRIALEVQLMVAEKDDEVLSQLGRMVASQVWGLKFEFLGALT